MRQDLEYAQNLGMHGLKVFAVHLHGKWGNWKGSFKTFVCMKLGHDHTTGLWYSHYRPRSQVKVTNAIRQAPALKQEVVSLL